MASGPAQLFPASPSVAVANQLADDVLFPAALDVESQREVPVEQLDALAAAGLYGLFGPTDAGGLNAEPSEGWAVMEALAGGCLTTAFVWAQHHSSVRAVASSSSVPVREEWLACLCRGDCRAGVAFAGLRRPGPPVLTATPTRGGWRLDGFAPWVTGWGRIDVIHVGARHGDQVVWSLIDASAAPTLSAQRFELAAVNASATVTLTFAGHLVPQARVTAIESFADWRTRDALRLRANGSHPLGVSRRCARLLAETGADAAPLFADVDAVRAQLDAAGAASGPGAMVEARAQASLLAMRAASALVAAGGGRAVSVDQHGQRLLREAMFLLVFGQTPAIKTAQMSELLDP